jgi:hypothetical protein
VARGGTGFTVILRGLRKEALAVGRRIMKSIGQHEFRSPGTKSATSGDRRHRLFPQGRAEVRTGRQAIRAILLRKSDKNCLCVYGDETSS